MSVATKNPFAILDAEDSSPAPAAAPSSAAPPASNTRGRGGSQPRGAGGGGGRGGGKYYARGGPGGGAPAQNRTAREGEEAVNANSERPPRRQFDGEARGRGGRGRGGPRGDRGDRGYRGGGRGGRLDRHSATGKTDSDKKVHQSWGGDDGPGELKVEEAAATDAATDNAWGDVTTPADDPWGTSAAPAGEEPTAAPAAEGEGGEGRGRREREPEEEDNTVSYDQYLAQKAAEESALPKLAPRTANEGQDDSQWKDAVPVTKAEEEAYFAPKAKAASKPKAKKEEKVFIEIDARFERPSRGGERGRGGRGGDRGDRGGRGGGRGRGGERGPRGGRAAPGVDVADERAFPSLS